MYNIPKERKRDRRRLLLLLLLLLSTQGPCKLLVVTHSSRYKEILTLRHAHKIGDTRCSLFLPCVCLQLY